MGLRLAAERRLAATRAYAILDGSLLSPARIPSMARSLRNGGIRVFQLRMKGFPDSLIMDTAIRLRRALKGCTMVVNDRCDLARAAGADGVHLGQDDLRVAEARRVLGTGAWIGLSAGNPAEVRRALRERPDCISIGPVFSTRTKGDAGRALGVRGFGKLAAMAGKSRPVLAVGGIRADNVEDLIRNGASAVAVASWLTSAGRPDRSAALLVAAGRAAARKAGRGHLEHSLRNGGG